MKLFKKYVLDEYEYIFNFIKITDQYMLGEFNEEYVKNVVLGNKEDYALIGVYYFVKNKNNELIEVIIDMRTRRTITEKDIPSTISHWYYQCYSEVIELSKKYRLFGLLS